MKKILIIFAIIVIVAGATFFFLQGKHQKEITKCEERCDFVTTTKAWTYDDPAIVNDYMVGGVKDGKWVDAKFFENQKQCIDYCLGL